MNFEVKDLAGISKPIGKLIEVVSAGIGGLYRPNSMRKNADAQSYAIRTLANAEAEAEIIKTTGKVRAKMAGITTLAGENTELIERAKLRLLTREVEGQLNTEAVAEQALLLLPDTVSDIPVSEDWRRKFFIEVENICDHDLQLLWGKVLAGEVTVPGSYSLRTLEVLKHLSKEDAEVFRQACNLSFADGWIMKPGVDHSRCLESYGLTYDALLTLRDAGLMFEGDTLIKDWSRLVNLPSMILSNNGIYIQISGANFHAQTIPSLPFTRAGRELQNLLTPNPCLPYIQVVVEYFRARGFVCKKGNQVLTESGHTVLSFDEEF